MLIKGGYKNKCDCLVFGNILVFVMYNIIWYEYKVLNSKLIIIYLGIFNKEVFVWYIYVFKFFIIKKNIRFLFIYNIKK